MPAVAVNTTLMMLSRKASTVCGDDQKRGMLVEGVGRAKKNNETDGRRGGGGGGMRHWQLASALAGPHPSYVYVRT